MKCQIYGNVLAGTRLTSMMFSEDADLYYIRSSFEPSNYKRQFMFYGVKRSLRCSLIMFCC